MIRIGMVGIGQIAEDYLSIFAKGEIKEAKITALASRNEDRVKGLIKDYDLGSVHYDKTLEEMLKDDKIDAVMITTPHTLHEDMARLAIKYGKHVLVDKPLGITTMEVDRLDQLAEENPKLTLGVLFNRRSNDLYQKVKEITSSKELGELRRASWQITNLYRTYAYYETSSWRGSFKTEGGGVLMNQAIHQLDLFLWFTGMPEAVMAYTREGFHRPMNTENDVNMTMFYPEGATGHFIASTHESPGTNRLELSYTKGQIIVEDDARLKITRLLEEEESFAKKETTFFTHVPMSVEEITMDPTPNKEEQKRTIQNFIDAINKKADVLCSFKEGKNTVRMVNSAYLSSWKNKLIRLDFRGETYQKELDARIES